MNYQGRLFDSGGNPVPDGSGNSLTFRICADSGCGSPLWTEVWNGNVATSNGLFNVILGSNGSPVNLPFDAPYWLEVQVHNGVGWETLLPRQQLVTAPYAFNAGSASGLTLPFLGSGTDAANLFQITNNGGGTAITGDETGGGIGVRGLGMTGTAGVATSPGGTGVVAEQGGGALALNILGNARIESGSFSVEPGSTLKVQPGATLDVTGATVLGFPGVPNPLYLTNNAQAAIGAYTNGSNPALVAQHTAAAGPGFGDGIIATTGQQNGRGVFARNNSPLGGQAVFGVADGASGFGLHGQANAGIGVRGVGVTGVAGIATGVNGFGVWADNGAQPGAIGLRVIGGSSFSGTHDFSGAGNTVDFTGATVLGLGLGTPNPFSVYNNLTSTVIGGYNTATGPGVLAQGTTLGLSATASSTTPGAVYAVRSNAFNADITTGSAYGVYGTANNSGAATGLAVGVQGSSSKVGPNGIGVQGLNSSGQGVRGQGLTGVAGVAVAANGVGVVANNGAQPGAIGLNVIGGSRFQGSHDFSGAGNTVDFTGATVLGLPLGVPNPLSVYNNVTSTVIGGYNSGAGAGVSGQGTLVGVSGTALGAGGDLVGTYGSAINTAGNATGVGGVGTGSAGFSSLGVYGEANGSGNTNIGVHGIAKGTAPIQVGVQGVANDAIPGTGVAGIGLTGTAGSAAVPGGIGVVANNNAQPGAIGLSVIGGSKFQGTHDFTGAGNTVDFTGATVFGLPTTAPPVSWSFAAPPLGYVLSVSQTANPGGDSIVGYNYASMVAGVRGVSLDTTLPGPGGASAGVNGEGPVGVVGQSNVPGGMGMIGTASGAGAVGGFFTTNDPLAKSIQSENTAPGGVALRVVGNSEFDSGSTSFTAHVDFSSATVTGLPIGVSPPVTWIYGAPVNGYVLSVSQTAVPGGDGIVSYNYASAAAAVAGISFDATAPGPSSGVGVFGRGPIGLIGDTSVNGGFAVMGRATTPGSVAGYFDGVDPSSISVAISHGGPGRSLWVQNGDTRLDGYVSATAGVEISAGTAPFALDINGSNRFAPVLGAPASLPGEGRLIFDGGSNQFMISENGGAWTPMSGVPNPLTITGFNNLNQQLLYVDQSNAFNGGRAIYAQSAASATAAVEGVSLDVNPMSPYSGRGISGRGPIGVAGSPNLSNGIGVLGAATTPGSYGGYFDASTPGTTSLRAFHATPGGHALEVAGDATFDSGSTSFTAHVDFSAATVTGLPLGVPVPLNLTSTASPVFSAENNGVGQAILALSNSPGIPTLRAQNFGTPGIGVEGETFGANTPGVRGMNTSLGGWGVEGIASGGRGVVGQGVTGVAGTTSINLGAGVLGTNNVPGGGGTIGYGVIGAATAADTRFGVLGTTVPSPALPNNDHFGVFGAAPTGIGVAGIGLTGVAGVAVAPGQIGVVANAPPGSTSLLVQGDSVFTSGYHRLSGVANTFDFTGATIIGLGSGVTNPFSLYNSLTSTVIGGYNTGAGPGLAAGGAILGLSVTAQASAFNGTVQGGNIKATNADPTFGFSTGIRASADNFSTGDAVGLQGVAQNFGGGPAYGVQGTAGTAGIYGTATLPNGVGVWGQGAADRAGVRGDGVTGVAGTTVFGQGWGVYGNNAGTVGGGGGVYGRATWAGQSGVLGRATDFAGTGVLAENTAGGVALSVSHTAQWFGTSPGPGVSPLGAGRIYFDSGSNQFMVSENGAPYQPLLGAGGLISVTSTSGTTAIYGHNVSTGIGIFGEADSGTGYGVIGQNNAPNGIGVQGQSVYIGVRGSVNGTAVGTAGVRGESFGVTGVTAGVVGQGSSPAGWGVLGENVSGGGAGVQGQGLTGVAGISSNGSGVGVMGHNTSPGGDAYGVIGVSDSPSGHGVGGRGFYGVEGGPLQPGGAGVYAHDNGIPGALALTVTGDAVFAAGSTSFTAHVDFSGATVTGLPLGVANPLSVYNNLTSTVIGGYNSGPGPGVYGSSSSAGLSGTATGGGVEAAGVYAEGSNPTGTAAGVVAFGTASPGNLGIGTFSVGKGSGTAVYGVIGQADGSGGTQVGVQGNAIGSVPGIGVQGQGLTGTAGLAGIGGVGLLGDSQGLPGSLALRTLGNASMEGIVTINTITPTDGALNVTNNAGTGVAIGAENFGTAIRGRNDDIANPTLDILNRSGGVALRLNNVSFPPALGAIGDVLTVDGGGGMSWLPTGGVSAPLNLTSTTAASTIYTENTSGAGSALVARASGLGIPVVDIETSAGSGHGIYVRNTGAGGTGFAIRAETNSSLGSAIYGHALSGTTSYGVRGISNGSTGVGVYGEANASLSTGVRGYSNFGYGVQAEGGAFGLSATADSATGIAVFGRNAGSNATALLGNDGGGPALRLDRGFAEFSGDPAGPPVSTPGEGRIYFDSGSNQFMVSENGAGYVPMVSGGVSAPLSLTNTADQATIYAEKNGPGEAVVAGTNDNSASAVLAENTAATGGPFAYFGLHGRALGSNGTGVRAQGNTANGVGIYADAWNAGYFAGNLTTGIGIYADGQRGIYAVGNGSGGYGVRATGNGGAVGLSATSSSNSAIYANANTVNPAVEVVNAGAGTPLRINGMNFPVADGAASNVLSTDGLGNLYWGPGGGGSPTAPHSIYGNLTSTAVGAYNTGSGPGVSASAATGPGVYGFSQNGNGVEGHTSGLSPATAGVYGTSINSGGLASAGVEGLADNGSQRIGVLGRYSGGMPPGGVPSGIGIAAINNTNTGWGLYAQADNPGGRAIVAKGGQFGVSATANATGVYAEANNFGVRAKSTNGVAIEIDKVAEFVGGPPPAVSGANQGRIYYDDGPNQFMVSENGGAYQPLLGGVSAPLSLTSTTMASALSLYNTVAGGYPLWIEGVNQGLRASTSSGPSTAILGSTSAGASTAVRGWATAGNSVGVYGQADAVNGVGVEASAIDSTGVAVRGWGGAAGVSATASSATGSAIIGHSASAGLALPYTGMNRAAVVGINSYANPGYPAGVFGKSTASTSGIGVYGVGGSNAAGVYGEGGGVSGTGSGVHGYSGSSSSSSAGVQARHGGPGAGVNAYSTSGPAIRLERGPAAWLGMSPGPAASGPAEGRIYFDSGSNQFMVSENGGAYQPLLGGGGASAPLSLTLNSSVAAPLFVTNSNGVAVSSTAAFGTAGYFSGVTGVVGISSSALGQGGYFENLAGAGDAHGLMAAANSPTGMGVLGFNKAAAGDAIAVFGYSGTSPQGRGAFFIGSGIGVKGQANSATGVGVEASDAGILGARALEVDGSANFRTTMDFESTALPAISPLGKGRIYFDGGSGQFMVSEDGAGYVPMLGGGGAPPFDYSASVPWTDAVLDAVNTSDGYGLRGETQQPGSLAGPISLGSHVSAGVYGMSSVSLSAGVLGENYTTDQSSAGIIGIGANGVIGVSTIVGGEALSADAAAGGVGLRVSANNSGATGGRIEADAFGLTITTNAGSAIYAESGAGLPTVDIVNSAAATPLRINGMSFPSSDGSSGQVLATNGLGTLFWQSGGVPNPLVLSNATNSPNAVIRGSNTGGSGAGVRGETSSGVLSYGVYGDTTSIHVAAAGVIGRANGASGPSSTASGGGIGVVGTAGGSGYGVWGLGYRGVTAEGTGFGLSATASAATGRAIYASNNSSNPTVDAINAGAGNGVRITTQGGTGLQIGTNGGQGITASVVSANPAIYVETTGGGSVIEANQTDATAFLKGIVGTASNAGSWQVGVQGEGSDNGMGVLGVITGVQVPLSGNQVGGVVAHNKAASDGGSNRVAPALDIAGAITYDSAKLGGSGNPDTPAGKFTISFGAATETVFNDQVTPNSIIQITPVDQNAVCGFNTNHGFVVMNVQGGRFDVNYNYSGCAGNIDLHYFIINPR